MPTISVIVPVYKVEPYLRQCVDSILGQTFRDFELILVDDGSPDNCPAICDEYAAKDCRIRVIHQKNGGLSAARNAGLDIATGEYISFVDSDDWLEDTFLEMMLNKIQNDEAEMAMCGVRKVWQESSHDFVLTNEDACLSRENAISLLAHTDWYYFVVWNKVYRRNLFESVRFPEGFIHEDEHIIHVLYDQCTRVSMVKCVLYNYRQSPDSIMGRKYRIQRTDKLSALAERISFSGNRKWREVCDFACEKYVIYFFEYYFLFERNDENTKYIRRMDNSLKKSLPFILRSPSVTIGKKMRIWLIAHIPLIIKVIQKRECPLRKENP